MRRLFWVGFLLIVLGVAAFIVPVPRTERHGVKIGGESVGIETRSNERLPFWVGGVLVVLGGAIMISGGRRA